MANVLVHNALEGADKFKVPGVHRRVWRRESWHSHRRQKGPDAPLVVGTTEIYRNQLFDSLRGGHVVNADLVVIDEAHYLADEERGHVWEEAIILTPPRIRLLLLSATIGNARLRFMVGRSERSAMWCYHWTAKTSRAFAICCAAAR